MHHRQSRVYNNRGALPVAVAVTALLLAVLPGRELTSQATGASRGAALVRKYANSDMGSILLKEPPIRASLVRLLGDRLPQLERNLDVSGSVDVVDGSVAVSGNAPHHVGEEEGIVCMSASSPTRRQRSA